MRPRNRCRAWWKLIRVTGLAYAPPAFKTAAATKVAHYSKIISELQNC